MKKSIAIFAAALLAGIGFPTSAHGVSAPTSVSVESKSLANTALDQAVVQVTWAPVTGAVAYSVSATATGQTARAGSPSSCTVSLCSSTIGSLSGGVIYDFIVTAIDTNDNQAAAQAVKFEPKSIPAAPAVVSIVTVDGAINLTWSAPSTSGGLALDGYVITDGANITKNIAADKVSDSITTATAGSTYSFTIKAKNALGNSAASTFTTVTAVASPSAPAAPTIQQSASSITATWTAPAANGSPITGYKTYLIDNSGNDVGSATLTTTTTASITNIAAGTYTVKVVATNAVGDSVRSAASSSFTVAAGSAANTPVFTPTSLTNLDIGATQSVSVVAPSGGTVTVSTNSAVCTYSAGIVTAVASGLCTISASADATSGFAAGTASKTFTVKSTQNIVFASIANQTLPGTLTIAPTASSSLVVALAASGTCTISNRVITFTAAGTCTITASQAGSANFSAAPNVIRSFTIAAGTVAGGSGGGGSTGGGGGSTGGGGSSGGGGSTGGGGGTTTPTKPNRPIIIPSKPIASPSTYFATSSSTSGAASARVSGSSASVSVKIGKPVFATLTGLKAGTVVMTKIKSNDGKIFVLSPKKVGSSKVFSSSVIKPKKAGTYAIIMSYGSVTKTLKITVKK